MDVPSSILPSESILEQLPIETLFQILSSIPDLKDLASACQTSKTLYSICQDDSFWRERFRQDFGYLPTLPTGETWENYYRDMIIYSQYSPLSMGKSHAAIINNLGQLYTWGNNSEGQLGNNTGGQLGYNTFSPNAIPQLVIFGRKDSPQPKIVQVSCSFEQTAAITESGDLYAWGQNSRFGSLGVGLQEYVIFDTPYQIPSQKSIGKIIRIHAGDSSTIILNETGQIYIWGKFTTDLYSASPILLNDSSIKDISTIPSNEKIVDVATGAYFFMALTKSGKIYFWGQNPIYNFLQSNKNKIYGSGHFDISNHNHQEYLQPVLLPFNQLIRQISVGYNHLALVTRNGQLWMAGTNQDGQLGNGTTTDSHDLKRVILPEPILYVNCRWNTVVAMVRGGRFFMWGNNKDGQIIFESQIANKTPHANTNQLVISNPGSYGIQIRRPTEISIDTPIRYMLSGGLFTVALTSENVLNMWGRFYI